MTLRSAILAAVTGETAQETDPYYNLVSLHLKGDVNTGRTYNAFSDASSNNFRLTNNGEVRGSSFSPYNTSWSNYFSGSSQYLSVADSTAFTLGSGDFTVEAWVYKTSTGRQAITGQTDSVGANTSASFGLEINASNKVVGSVCSGATGYLATSTADIVLNQWNHIAFVRDGNTLRIYINGVQDGTASVTGITVNDSTNQLAIGRIGEYASLYWIGYISNCRLVKGRCVYPNGTTFNPSTAPLTRTTGGTNPPQGTECSLLTCQSNRFIDNSIANTGNTPFTITANGSPTVSSFSPFLEADTTTGSGYFDGTGDFLSIADNAALNPDTSDFTVEAWIYPTSLSGLQVIHYKSENDGTGVLLAINNSGAGKVNFYIGNAGNWLVLIDSSITIPANSWAHVVGTRSGNTYTLWVNGVSVGTATNAGSPSVTANDLRIGRWRSAVPYDFNGYISNYRLVKGAAVYTGAFTPPTKSLARSGADSAASYPSTTNVNTSFAASATSLLTLQERGAYNTIGFQDESEYQHVITRPSGANVAQGTFSPFSQTGWGNYFDGSNDNVSVSSSTDLAAGSGAFTVEAWIFTADTSFMVCASQTVGGLGFGYNIDNGTQGLWIGRVGQGPDATSGVQLTYNQWNHIAVTRDASNNVKFFVNGTQVGSTATVTTNYGTSAQGLYIGTDQNGTNFPLAGYISNLRYIKGQSILGTATSFTVPTSPLTSTAVGWSGTGVASSITGTVSLLTCQSNRFVDNSTTPKTLTPNNGPLVVAFSPFKPPAYDPQVHGGSGYFDGSGDYLSWPSGASVAFGTGDFTVEMWAYQTSFSSSYYIDARNASQTNAWAFLNSLNAVGDIGWFNGSSALVYSSVANAPKANQWNHLVYVRSGTIGSIFVNGVRVATATDSTNYTISPTTSYIGCRWAVSDFMTGYLSSLRIVKGTAVYDPTQTTITVPTAPLPLLGNTSLLLNFTNAGVIDSTGKNVIETVGNAGVVTTAIKKYGSGSMFFDGTGDSLITVSKTADFGTGNFTVECWIYVLNSSIARWIMDSRNTGSDAGFGFFLEDSTGYKLRVYRNGNYLLTSSSNIAINTWYHVVFVRNNSNSFLYIDGTQVASAADTNSYIQSGSFRIGTGWNNDNFFNGNIDDLRVTKGYARYTTGTDANANQMVFTGTNTLALPTKAHPDRGTASTLTTDMAAPSTVEALVVAGGGGGGGNRGGGGGAGGYREFVGGNALVVSAGANYQLTIGAGGTAGSTHGLGGSGNHSSITGSTISENPSGAGTNTIKAYGGGGGAGNTVSSAQNGANGGSGGGAGLRYDGIAPYVGTAGSGNTPLTSPSQGNSGGSAYAVSGTGYAAGGGGGANAIGGNAQSTSPYNGGNGGNGTVSTISGSSVTYAGGGGGGTYRGTSSPSAVGGTGGSGGGGTGGYGNSGTGITAGSSNTGGGGGGGSGGDSTSVGGAAGGSGVVIIAYPSTFKPLKASLGLVYTIDTVTRPGYRVYKFTAGTGSISW